MDWEAINGWQRYFERTGKDVFDVLESAITVAAWHRPDEFFKRRDGIAQLLFARRKQTHDIDDVSEEDTTHSSSFNDFSDMGLKIDDEYKPEGRDQLASKKSTESKAESHRVTSDSEKCSAMGTEGLRPLALKGASSVYQIGNVEINCSNGTNAEDHQKRPRHIIRIKLPPKPKKEEQLQALKLEEANPKSEIERSHKNTTQIRPALEESEAKCDGEEKSCRGREETKAVPEQVQNVTAKSSKKSRERKIIEETEVMMMKKHKSMCLNEKALQVKLEASKRKLQEGYKQFESAKKKIRMIELKDLPQKGVDCRPPVNRIQGHCRPLNRTRCSYIR